MKPKSLPKIPFIISLVASFVFATPVPAQSDSESINMEDIFTIKSPSPKFKSIHLQAHLGLPRFGAQNMYHKKNRFGGIAGIDRPKNKLLKVGYQNYFNLLGMKFLSSYYDDIDREYLTVVNRQNADNKKDLNSKTAQKKLQSLALGIGTKSQITKYFCDPDDGNCRFRNNWSGTRDDFSIQEKYAAYVKENLDELRAWSKTLFKNNALTAYWVHKYEFNPYGNPTAEYDFGKKGYWIDVFPSRKNNHQKGHQYHGDQDFFFEFLPETSYGNKHLNRMSDTSSYWPKMLLPINPSEAEALINRKSRNLYATFKVNILFKEVNETHAGLPKLEYTFHLASPIISFYEDVELTQKIGEISLEQPIYKAN